MYCTPSTKLGRIMRLLKLFCLLVEASLCSVTFAVSEKPNIIVILADDFGFECLGANGGKSYRTPNLDALARQGARFTQCYAQPNCTPTRVQMITGK
jgi:arylsulfatase A